VGVIADVAMRALFNDPLPGMLDVTQYALMPTLISLGLGFALVRNEHIRVNLLTAPTGARTQRIAEILAMTFTLTTVATLAWFGVVKAQAAQQFGEGSRALDWLPIWPFRWVVVVGFVVLALQAIAQLARAIVVPVFTPPEEHEVADAIDHEKPLLDDSDRIAGSLEVHPR
jgi:TRAP-type mannitol/chloroaromatic compound transport system permease small subunit